MIKKLHKPELDMSQTMAQHLHPYKNTLEKVFKAVDVVMNMPINGCITGSVWLPNFNPDAWGTIPDIDIFVYTEADLIKAIDYAELCLKMKPGKGTEKSEEQERWKINRFLESGLNRKIGINTFSFYYEDIILNFTYKVSKIRGNSIPITNAPSILMSFDMSMVMQGYDIQSGVMYDLRPEGVPNTTAVPNPLRKVDTMVWTVNKWVRQFDRVVKYYERGYDTRPMAEFYIEMIDECIKAGNLFDSENSKEMFDVYSSEFLEKRKLIEDWLNEHKED